MDYNKNDITLVDNKTNRGTWQGDTRACEKGQIIYGCVTFNSNRPMNINNMEGNQPIKTSVSSDSSTSSDGSTGSKTITWGQLSSSGSKTNLIGSKSGQRSPENSRPGTLEKTKNGKMMTWKDVSPTKSALGSDLEGSGNANVVNDNVNKCGKLTNQMRDNERCDCKNHSNDSSPCKKGSACCCSKQCISHRTDNDNETSVTRSSGSSNDNGSPRKERGCNSADDTCNNDYFYDEDFSVQFDTNLRETSVTPVDVEPTPSILDFPHMVTGSYLSFNNAPSSNASYNNMRESANLSVNNVPGTCTGLHFIEDRGQNDSEFSGNSGNSGSRNSAMELSSSEKDMMCSSDMIEFSDGPLFTPTPVHILSTDSLDRNIREVQGQGQGSEMNNSSASNDANLNVDCCPRKEDYFLSFDGSNTRVSGSETDCSLSATSHDSGQGHWVHSETSTSAESGSEGVYHMDGVPVNVSSSENQEESSDSFHFCYSSKLSPKHRQGHHYAGKDGVTGRVIKRLVPLKETIPESTDSSEEEVEGNTSPTLTAGSKDVSTLSPQTSPQKQVAKLSPESGNKSKQSLKKKGQKSENLYLVGIGKPADILRKAQYHSHTLPVKNLVSWKQVKNLKKLATSDTSESKSLPELSNSTSWQSISSLKCRKISDISDSFHGKRHSSSLLEFYQRMKSESNPVSPETMKNLEQILLPDFIGQKQQETSVSSTSSLECTQCQCHRQRLGMEGSLTKAITNKRVSDWLKMGCNNSSSSREGRPSSLGCQTNILQECATKETLISPQTVTLWCGTKNAASQFPPVTKDCSIQTTQNSKYKDCGLSVSIGKKDQGLQTSDFDTDELLSILSEDYDDYRYPFLMSNEGFAKDFQRNTSCPENLYAENGLKSRVPRSKSADEYKNFQKNMNPYDDNIYLDIGQGRSRSIGRSRSAGGLGKSDSMFRRMGYSSHYSYNSLPDIAFLMSSSTISKDESKESLFDPLKIDLPTPVLIKPKTELEKFDIYNQKAHSCSHHKTLYGSEHKTRSSGHRNVHQIESASSSSGFSTSSSSGIDPGYCQCEQYYSSSPQNDLERLIFFPPHTEISKVQANCCGPKRRAHSVPKCLSEYANIPQGKMEKYAYEVHPQSGVKGQGQTRLSQKYTGSKLVATETKNMDNLYAVEEEQTPVASPEQICCHSDKCSRNGCYGNKNSPPMSEQGMCAREYYKLTGRVLNVDHEYLREFSTDSASSSGSYAPNTDKKPLKSCLRKKNKGLRSRSMSDTFSSNFDDAKQKQKAKNRHSYACDEVYIVSDEYGQLMMYQADEAAEPVMFYLDKDGECRMTEGGRPELEVQPTDVMGSDSSSEKESGGKRKSVSFASEVSFQAISPMSPKKQISQTDETTDCGKDGENNAQTENKAESTETEKSAESTAAAPATPVQGQDSANPGGCHSNNSSSSSSEGAPEEFQVAMDTNENNLWTENVMEEKLGLLSEVSKAAEILVEHFAGSTDFFDKLRLGNVADTPKIGDLVLSTLCPALAYVISNGMKHHLVGFQMFGRVQVTIWKVVEASVETGPQTRTLTDLVATIKQMTFLTTHQQKFDAFVFCLLNYRLLDFWFGSIREKEEHLSKYYEPDAILLHSNTVLKAKYDSVVLSVQTLAALPFQLNSDFIKEKALSDSKIKAQEMASSKEDMSSLANQNQGNNSLNEATNESVPTEITSVLELTATKALNWITKAALPKMSPQDFSPSPSKSRSLPLDLSSQITDSNISTNEMSETESCDEFGKLLQRDTKSCNDIERLLEKHKGVYGDAKTSRIDSDHIISPTESMRSSQGSQYGPMAFFSNLTSKFDSVKTENQTTPSPSMTSSVTSLVNKFFQFGASLSQRQAYRKGVTEYNFEEDQSRPGEVHTVESDKETDVLDKVLDNNDVSEPVSQSEEKQSGHVTETTEAVKLRNKAKLSSPDKTSSKRVSFDIVNLFDKLLLPSSKDGTEKPANESKSRWSWGLGSKHEISRAKVKKVAKSKIPVTLNRSQSPKHIGNPSVREAGQGQGKQPAVGATAPPKPPRVPPKPSNIWRRVTQSDNSAGATKRCDVNYNSSSV